MEIRLAPPNEKQKLFLKDHHKHVAFGGARGGAADPPLDMTAKKSSYFAEKYICTAPFR